MTGAGDFESQQRLVEAIEVYDWNRNISPFEPGSVGTALNNEL
jgi:hypothetical protein